MFKAAFRTIKTYLPLKPLARDRLPIGTVDEVHEFARTRAAFVSQKKLYGYLKERIGTRYPKAIEDDAFSKSVNIAKLEVFAASLADMTCFCIGAALADDHLSNAVREASARACFRRGIEDNDDGSCGREAQTKWFSAFDARLEKTDWTVTDSAHFIESASALVRWAPIADELKTLDRDIVENSITNAFVEVRAEFHRRLDRDGVLVDFKAAD
ncbi:MAG: hypothetical protein AAGA88_12625 [Pseudomonadota bacterium]